MTGTFINFFGIIVGGLVGLLIKKGIPLHINAAIMKMQGFAVCIIGLFGMISAMFSVNLETGALEQTGGLLLIVSLVIGCIVGEVLKIDATINKFGLFMESKLRSDGFAKGFISASLMFSIGAMAVIGPLNDGLTGDTSVLLVKSLLDTTTAIILASALGVGVIFSAVPVLVVQGTIALLAVQISPFVSDELLKLFCGVAYALVICIGLNVFSDAKIKIANLLPSLAVPVVYYFAVLA